MSSINRRKFLSSLGALYAAAQFPVLNADGEHKPVQLAPVSEGQPGVQRFFRESNHWGFNDDWDIGAEYNPEKWQGMKPEVYQIMGNAGMGWQRYNLYWHNVNPAPGVYDWTAPDASLGNAMKAGQHSYVTIFWGPAWATGGQNWHEPFHCMTWPGQPAPYNDASRYEATWGFLYDRPECADPATMNAEAFGDFVKKCIQRYDGKNGRPLVKHWGVTNEATNWTFWPPRYRHRGKPDVETLQELVDWRLLPAAKALRQVAKEDKRELYLVGPDENGETILDALLTIDAQGQERGDPQLFDIITGHPYGSVTEYPKDALWQVDNKYLPIMRAKGNGRPFWITESGYAFDNKIPDMKITPLELQAERLLKFYEGMWARRSEIDKFFVYRAANGRAHWMPDVDTPGQLGIIGGDLKPFPAYDAIRNFIMTRGR